MQLSIEKHGFTITVASAISAIFFVIYSTASIVQIKADLITRTGECKTEIVRITTEQAKQDAKIDSNTISNNNVAIKLAGIEVQVVMANTSLQEIKKSLNIK